MCLISGTKWLVDMAGLDKGLWVDHKHLCVCVRVSSVQYSMSSVTHADVLSGVYYTTSCSSK